MTPVWLDPDRESRERRYDGPIPDAPRPLAERRAAQARLYAGLLADQRRSLAVRRLRVPAVSVVEDVSLRRGCANLALYRHAVAAREKRRG